MPAQHIVSFLRGNLATIEHPADSRRTHSFVHLSDLIDAFLCFLEHDSGEPAVAALGNKILASLDTFAAEQGSSTGMHTALEELAVGFESFLKKLAVMKYGARSVELCGDGTRYKGLLETSLGGLLEGQVAKIKPRDASIPFFRAPLVSFSYSGSTVRDAVYGRTRELRNEIHEAPARTLFDVLRLFRTIVAAYLFAVEENLPLIRRHADPRFRYLRRLSDDVSKWNAQYIELSGELRPSAPLVTEPELMALEWHDGPFEMTAASERPISSQTTRRSVRELPQTFPRFWLIGEPGAGKTTTLQALAGRIIEPVLATGILSTPCPVFLRAALFAPDVSLPQMIARQLQVPLDSVEALLESGELQVLIDGMNEIPEPNFDCCYAAAARFLACYPDVRCILTSRRFGFVERLGLPVFELLPLEDADIRMYLQAHIGAEAAYSLYSELVRGRGLLLELARNPLMLSMIALISRDGGMPANRGHLFRLFAKWILNREAKRSTFPADLKEHGLSAIAYRLRRSGALYAVETLILAWLEQALRELHSDTDVLSLLRELINNNLLETGPDDSIRFPHELFLEYYCARRMRDRYLNGDTTIDSVVAKSAWREPIVMCAGLLTDADTFVGAIIERDVLLGARCLVCGARIQNSLLTTLMQKASALLALGGRDRATAGAALLELGSKDALRLIAKDSEADQYLEQALQQCERPEMAALRLLRFGLTGRHRIFMCLKAIGHSWSSVSLLDSDEVAAAQRALLSGNPDSRELNLIAHMGLSPHAVDTAADCVSAAFRQSLKASRWRSYLALCFTKNSPGVLRKLARQSLVAADPKTPEDEFTVFCGLRTSGTLDVQLRTIAEQRAVACFNKRLYGLGLKYVREFGLQSSIAKESLLSHAKELADGGRLGLILEMWELYSEWDGRPCAGKAFDVLLSRQAFETIFQYGEKLLPIVGVCADKLRNSIIKATPEAVCRRPRGLLRFVRKADLGTLFEGIAIVARWSEVRKFGFLRVVSTGECLFAHESRLRRPKGEVVRLGQFYDYQAGPPLPGKLKRGVTTGHLIM